ncbi:hypothetical protein cco112_03695 [Campylobacter coli 2685]|uniref:Uncharacterized protein n=1 Tax=Campylobacter coli 80352 TaxID=887288 RepID=A0ABN0ENR1_CAMCO|nr:hypothetical protein CCO1710 [Campylobacter coli RM2228]EIA44156.1 hypothetical protein cco100_01407 [Campylobacter coli Z163]EIA48202.1 hypothetical protein cco105_05069 [Campylobacter coli 2548]EIA48442.1 hypothetical protein cco106_08147 [Campylobacter coli 2553]EIA52728.1 hypothetical protein cco112_03695 [Campylobacter coli 2685]EIA55239.1 hypothetical protein cco113_04371 [Campylobacter coli 2688]EIA57718.1 hypothetical protein cco117_03688 [Campylobacter coli 2698]EIA63139.1 hypoth
MTTPMKDVKVENYNKNFLINFFNEIMIKNL